MIRCGQLIMLHEHLNRYSGVLIFITMLASFFIDTTLLICLVALTYIIGFIWSSLIFIINGPVSPDTRSFFSEK